MATKELTNLLLSTTYALNKSYSKRVIIGLENYNGRYRVVVKICGSGSPSKFVTLDALSWEVISDQMDAIDAYLNNAYGFYQEFGAPNRIYLENHDLSLTTAYNARAVTLEARFKPKNAHDTQDERGEEGEIDETTSAKRRKTEIIPSITMHATTFDGLKTMNACIKERVKILEEWSNWVNHYLDCISEFLKEKLAEQSVESAKNILKNFAEFKKFYTLNRVDIDNKVRSLALFNDFMYNIFMEEVAACGLSTLAKDVYTLMFP